MSDIRTSGQSNVGQTNYNTELLIDTKKQKVGSGAMGGTGETPPTEPRENMANALASLSGFMSGGAGVDVDVLLVQIAVSMRDTEATSQKSKINTDQEAKKAEMKEKEAKLEEAGKKMAEAERKRNSGNLLDKIKLAFEWLGAILAVALAAVMIATGVGAVVGGLLIAAAVCAVVMAVDSTVTSATGMGIAGNIAYADAKAHGKSDTEAKEIAGKADMGFKITMAVLGIAFSIAAGGASIGGAVKSAVQAGMKAAETASSLGSTVGQTIKQVASATKEAFFLALKESGSMLSQGAKMARNAIEAADAINTAGTAGMEIGRAVVKHDETTATADAKQLQAKAKQDEALIQMLDDLIDQALTRLMAASDRFNAILDGITEAMQDRGNTMGRARFAG